MTEPGGKGRAALVAGETEFGARDAALLRAVHRTGSVAAASEELGRSRARALKRIEALEAAFGQLVERRRGGESGGGSRLTGTAFDLLDRYDRLAAALAATASVPETVMRGTVAAVEGGMAEADTDVGTLRGRHDGVGVGDAVQVRIGADTVTLYDPETVPRPESTSARNRLKGEVAELGSEAGVFTVVVDVDGLSFRVLVTQDSAARLDLADGQEVGLTWKATATRLVAEHGTRGDSPR